MYSSYDYNFYLSLKELPKFYDCKVCRIFNRCSRKPENKSPCSDGRFHSFFYSRLAIPSFDFTDEDKKNAGDFLYTCGRNLQANFLVQAVGATVSKKSFVYAFEMFSKRVNSLQGLEVGYVSLERLRDIYIDYLQKDKISKYILSSIESCDVLFIDELNKEILFKSKGFQNYFKQLIDIRINNSSLNVFRFINNHVEILDFMQLHKEVIYNNG